MRIGKGRREGRVVYPGVVELGLHAGHFAFFLVLRAQDVELGGVERPKG